MPVSTTRFTEVRFAISDLIQKEDWKSLFELGGTSDDEQSRMVATIVSNYDPRRVWRFVEYVYGIPPEVRRSRHDSIRTVCYLLGKMGQSNTRRALHLLRQFLSEDHALRAPVLASLSNLWVLDTRITSSALLRSWILNSEEDDDLQDVAVRSCEFLATEEPAGVSKFLLHVSKLEDRKPASRLAAQILSERIPSSLQERRRKSERKKVRKKEKKHKHKKHKKRRR
jgi:hypothetical protein